MQEKEINLQEHIYEKGQKIEIDAGLFTELNNFMYNLIQEGQQASYLEVYPKESKENFVLDGDNQVLDNVEIEYKEYPNMASFTNQQPIWTLSPTAAKAKEYAFLFGEIHKENIINGVTVKRGEGNLQKTD